ncbi:Atxe2 family lasso peptide isopeptidase [Steroidobacter sp. S1-65]|uniref:Atxe2 family lasso peptide isopeptidase n=1 Tax=Steroidobacter gossypii TaxID=2805490 RepID=A0ABS1X239_9GAMM|nr:Atxe2 family lasso peptide isopeptidase [Steroidobacter gossypii]MBM0107284.1 Atxe2 family lasso peptide isopeptidase [Steroidobacter gossypii]
MKFSLRRVLLVAAALFAAHTSAHQTLTIPEVPAGTPRTVTPDDFAKLRTAERFSLSPDGKRFALLVRQGDATANEYRRAWYVGSVQGGALTQVGDGGETRLSRAGLTGRSTGTFERPDARWSPDGRWLAYTRLQDGEIQLWRGAVDARFEQQVTHNAADVREFEWSEDGRSLYFTVGATRAEEQAITQARERAGYRYDQDLHSIADLMLPRLRHAPPNSATTLWTVTFDGHDEQLASDADRAAFEQARGRADPTGGVPVGAIKAGTTVMQTERTDGARAWLVRSDEHSRSLRVHASLPNKTSEDIQCAASECSGYIERIWWVGNRVLFWRREGIRWGTQGIYTWDPTRGAVRTVLRAPDDVYTQCELGAHKRLVCMRETPTLPSHLAAIDVASGRIAVVADINPEFRNIRLGKVERVEWDTPSFPWSEPGQPLHGFYESRASGYIFYPPGFDANEKYPVYINPYASNGFMNITNQETPSHALAARGMVVLGASFPLQLPLNPRQEALRLANSAELDFPHTSMCAESTLRALDSVIARGIVDERRIGIGGVSQGAITSMFIAHRHDRVAAIAISGGIWSQLDYYVATSALPKLAGGIAWWTKPEGEGMNMWRGIDAADNVAKITAPILMNAPAAEMLNLVRLVKHLNEAGKPYDAYVFRDETHTKWQPAHLHAIVQRNLDWFDFWLRDREDPDPAKVEQYERWRKLKDQQQLSRANRSSQETALR